MKEIGKSKSVAVYTKYVYNDTMRTLICEFNSNGDIVKVDGLIDIKYLMRLLGTLSITLLPK